MTSPYRASGCPVFYRRTRTVLRRIAAASALILCHTAAFAAPLSLDERIACQTALDDVRWSHTLWPEVNPGPKPTRAEVIPDAAIRDKVLEQLRIEQALYGVYGERIDRAALQAEIDRMASATSAPDQLRDLYAALGNDADTIGECLARPALAERHLRHRFEADAERHAAVRARAADALAHDAVPATDASGKHADGSTQRTVTYLRFDDAADRARRLALPHAREVPLSAQEWDALLLDIDRATERDANTGVAKAQETDTSLYHRRVLERSANRLVLQVSEWPKQHFTDWWHSEAMHWQPALLAPSKSDSERALTLTLIGGKTIDYAKQYGPGDVMPDDTWRTHGGAPEADENARRSAVSTGSEMLVWGGDRGGVFDPATLQWRTISIKNAPQFRRHHTLVWTGKKLIVWGGWRGDKALADGGVYDPLTDTWDAVETDGAPEGRERHTAVWSGTEMLVWGGENTAGESMSSGGRYRPDTKSWTPIPTAGAPEARVSHTAVWADDRMIVWGGRTGQEELGTGGIFNPANGGSWQATPGGGPTKRVNHTAVWAKEAQQMIVWGGSPFGFGSRLTRTGNAWSWTSMSEPTGIIPRRDRHSAVWTGTHMIVFGGDAEGLGQSIDGASYEPETDTWTALPFSSELYYAVLGIEDHTAVWVNDRMLVWDGYTDLHHVYQANVLIYDPAGQGNWSVAGDWELPFSTSEHTAVWTGTEMVIWGGMFSVDGDHLQSGSGRRYIAATGDWVPMQYVGDDQERVDHTAIWTGTEMFVWGGYNADDQSVGRGARYNPLLGVKGEWTESSVTLGPPRASHKAVWTGTQMLVWGGYGTNINDWQSTGTAITPGVDGMPSTGTTIQAPAELSADARKRANFAMAWMPETKEMIVWGGQNSSGSKTFDDGWRYNPQTKVATLLPGSGEPRYAHEVVWTGNSLLVVGGLDGTHALGTEMSAFFPAQNAWTSAGAMAEPRVFHSLVWTGKEALAWGGLGASSFLQSGERITPPAAPGQAGTNTPMTLVGAPAARYYHTAVWAPRPDDPASGEMIVWGGQLADSQRTNSLGVYAVGGTPKPPAVFADGFE